MTGMTGTGEPLRVVIVDDQPVMRSGLAMIVSAHDDLEVVGEAGDGQAGLDLVATAAPDVVLMDIQMPELDGIEATRRLVQRGSATRVLILTTFGQEEYVFDAFEAGAAGFLLKTAEPRRIVDAIRTVADHDQHGWNALDDARKDADDILHPLDRPEIGHVHQHALVGIDLLAQNRRVSRAIVDLRVDEVRHDLDPARRAAERRQCLLLQIARHSGEAIRLLDREFRDRPE